MTAKPADRFTGPELCRLQAHEVVALLRAREVSPRELLDAAFARVDAVGAQINATPVLCRERAYAAAERLPREASAQPGWLGGLPLGIKDLTPVAGVRTTYGTAGLRDFVPQISDPLVTRLEARGGVVAGKTNTPEFGAGGNTFNEVYGPTLNPWDTALNAGGSSGGAAASLAAGEMWLSHGSDHGGSLRTPAAYCGVVGLRPSPGRAGGSSKEAGYLIEGVQGPMARSVRDCALFLDAMAGYDPQHPISYPAPAQPFQQAVERADGKLRVAFSADLGGLAPVEAEMAEHLAGVMARLEREGAAVEAYSPELAQLVPTYATLRGGMWAVLDRRMDPAIRRHLKPTLDGDIRRGVALSMAAVSDAQLERSALYHQMLACFERFDVLACPVVGCMPRPQSQEWVAEVAGQRFDWYMDWLRFAFLATVTGLPAMSVPVGLGPRGLPVGLQLIGPPRGEAALLAAARAVEVAVGGPLGPIDPVLATPQR